MRIAAAQIECRPGDIEANLALHLEAIEAARAGGAELVVFPELSLTDYLSDPDASALARSQDAQELRRLAEAVGPAMASVGFIEAGQDGRTYNSQALLSGGSCLHVHRKANLPTYGRLREGHHYSPGRDVRPALLPNGWRAATLICADTWNPALPWLAAIQHPELLIVPVASSVDAVGDEFDNPGGWDLNLRHTALTYGLPVVMVNHCGHRGGLRFWGGSRILDAAGRELARADAKAGLIFAELSRDRIAQARAQLPTIRDADPALVRTELNRLLNGEGT
jgi:predicted amidohydrolase